jgi:Coatomer WD associated region
VSISEFAYQRTKSWERLSFLYLATGATDKLRKMLKIAEMRGDGPSRAHNALMLGDARELVCGQRHRNMHVLSPPAFGVAADMDMAACMPFPHTLVHICVMASIFLQA